MEVLNLYPGRNYLYLYKTTVMSCTFVYRLSEKEYKGRNEMAVYIWKDVWRRTEIIAHYRFLKACSSLGLPFGL